MSAPHPVRLARIELLDSHGHPVGAHDVLAWPLRIGRALDNELVLADPHVAAHHAELAPGADGTLQLTALPSRNGVLIEHARRHDVLAAGSAAPLAHDARVRLGRTLLRVQQPDDPVPEELPLVGGLGGLGGLGALGAPGSTPRWLMPLLVVLALLWQGLMLWLESNPDAKPLDQAAPVLGLAAGLAVWSFGWGLMCKLFSGRFIVMPHLVLALAVLLVWVAANFVLQAIAFMADWPLASRLRSPVTFALAAWLVAQHLRIVAPRQGRRMGIAVALFALGMFTFQTATQWQRNDRPFAELYSTLLLPPAWRLAPALPIDEAVQRLQALEEPLAERSRKAREEEFEP